MAEFNWRYKGRCHKFGHDMQHAGPVIPKWIVSGVYMDPKDIVPHLFEELRPGFPDMCKPGDIIIAGRNFGMGPKMNGYIGMRALGLGLMTESMPFLGYRAALGVGLPVLDDCPGIYDLVEDGHEVEADFSTGAFINHTTGVTRQYAPLHEGLRELVALGGTTGYLRDWLARNRPPVAAAS